MANFFENLRIAIQLKKTALEFWFHVIFHIVLVLTYKRKEFKNQEIEKKNASNGYFLTEQLAKLGKKACFDNCKLFKPDWKKCFKWLLFDGKVLQDGKISKIG